MIPVLPTPHLSSRTGAWRVLRPVLESEKCNRCLLCWLFCPEGSIRREKDSIRIDLDYCKGCGICARECPRKALRMVEEASFMGEGGGNLA